MFSIEGLGKFFYKFLVKERFVMKDSLGDINSIQFATYLNVKASEMGIQAGITQIQKWLYICYGLFLELNDVRLLDEQPIAGNYGPFFPKVYEAQKLNGDTLSNLDFQFEINFEYEQVVDSTLHYFGYWSASRLVNWTHQRGTAWYKKYAELNEKYEILNDDDIISDFRNIIIRE